MGNINEWVLSIMDKLGYFGVTAMMFLENIFPPIPSELVMPAAGFTAAQGNMHIVMVIIAGTLGSVLGALPLYYLGTKFDESRLLQATEKYGKWLFVKPRDVTKANNWFDKYGPMVVFFGRMVPGIRSLISIPAGMNHMSLLPFLLLTTIGSAIWTSLLAYAGYGLGANYEKVEKYISPISKVVLGAIIIAIIIFIIKRLKTRNDR